MPPRRRTDPGLGRRALDAWRTGAATPRETTTAVRFTLESLAAAAPGSSVEVRVPPSGVVQCLQGPRHTRGTPPNVVETDPATWLALVTGGVSWQEALADGRLRASGERADLSELLPMRFSTLDR